MTRISTVKYLLIIFAISWSAVSFAQQGTLRGGEMKLSNGTNALTLKLPASPNTFTLTLPKSKSNGRQYLYSDGTGSLNWGNPVDTTANASTVLYNTDHPQIVALPGTKVFDVGYAPGADGPAVGARVNSTASGPSGTSITGLDVTARNEKGASSHGDHTAFLDTVCDAGTGTNVALKVSVTGGGSNYAAITTEGSVGIGTTTPTDSLEVSGNIRISGNNGLKINEGTNATMGIATANSTNAVVVSTTKVTLTSRIILTAQTAGAVPGTLYVSARTVGASFSFKSTAVGDNSTVAWIIIEP
jgi:hypothetical protein